MGGPWAIIQSANIHSNWKISVPPVIDDRVVYVHEKKGESVRWHRDKEANAVVVSSVELKNDRYVHYTESTVHDQSHSITPDNDLLESICDRLDDFYDADQLFPENGTCVYIAPHQMIYEKPYTSYLLNSRRLFKMINTDQTQEGSLSRIMRSATC